MRKRIVASVIGAIVLFGAAGVASADQVTDGGGVHLIPPVKITRQLPTCPRGRKVLKPEWQAMHCKLRRGQRLDIVMTHRTYVADQVAACDGMGGWLYRTPNGLWSVCVGVDY
jgi:hypothetical protein